MKIRNRRSYMAAVMLIAVVASCKPSDDKMAVKLNRKIERSQEKISHHERKIAGYEQRLALLHVEVDTNTDNDKVITTLMPVRQDFEKFIDIQGSVSSKENVIISANMGGVLMSVLVTEGQYVEKGQILAIVNSDIIQSSIREVESALTLAREVYERQKRLWLEEKIGTELQYLQAKNNVENLESKLNTLQVQLGDSRVRTIVSGMVDDVFVNQGSMVGPGSAIARVVNLNKVQVEAEIPESFVGVFKKGDKVKVYFQSIGVTREAEIKAVGNVINPGNRTFKIEVELSNTDHALKPNMLATLKLKDYESKDKIVIPNRLVQEGSKGNFVYTVESDTVRKVWVKAGETYNGSTEILEGLDISDTLIDLGSRDVVIGDRVRIK